MNYNKLIIIKEKLIKFKFLIIKNRKGNYYLSIDDKIKLIKEGKSIPIRVKGNGRDLNLVVKTRGVMESGEIKYKRLKL